MRTNATVERNLIFSGLAILFPGQGAKGISFFVAAIDAYGTFDNVPRKLLMRTFGTFRCGYFSYPVRPYLLG